MLYFDERRFKAQMTLKGYSNADIAKALGVNDSTLWRKLKQGGTFSRDEMVKLIEVLDITDPDSIFFAHELA